MARPTRILYLEDNPRDAELVRARLTDEGMDCEIVWVQTGTDFVSAVDQGGWALIISDFTLSAYDGMSALALARTRCPDTPVIFFSGTVGMEAAIDALKNGATDYVLKQRPARLVFAVKRALQEAEERAERRRAEEERSQLAAIVASSEDAIIGKTLDSIITSWNRGAETIYGYKAAEAVGRHISIIVPPERNDEVWKLQESIKQGERIIQYETVRMRKDGHQINVSLTASPIKDSAGKIVGISAIIRDITERKQAEEALRDSELRLRSVTKTANDAIVSADSRGVLIAWNKGAHSIFGYTPDEVIGQPLTMLMPERYRDAHRKGLERFLSTGETRVIGKTVELGGLRKDGTEFPLELSLSNWTAKGGPFFTAIIRDITERKSLEAQLRQSQKIEAIGQLTGGIAHDFNNVLTVILGYSELALKSLPPDALQRDHVEQIKEAGERASLLTKQLLAFSRKQVLQPKVLDLNGVLTNLDLMLQRLIGEDIALVTVPSPGLWRVYADPSQIEQVMMNLAVNARDAMPNGGKLTIETANVQLDEAYARWHGPVQPGPYVMLAVSDTGCGMDAETQTRIFEPFFTTKEPGKGTGLGLSTVYGIVKQSGGYIWVYSEVGRCTAFKIYLPRVERAVETVESGGVSARTVRGSETILLVEDDNRVRDLIRSTLQAYGYTVLEAHHGKHAIQVCEQHGHPIHLLVTDVVMPEMGGREVAERLKPARPDMKVLFISGYTGKAIVHNGELDPGIAFLQKPFTPDVLVRKVREVLDAPER